MYFIETADIKNVSVLFKIFFNHLYKKNEKCQKNKVIMAINYRVINNIECCKYACQISRSGNSAVFGIYIYIYIFGNSVWLDFKTTNIH